MEKLNKIEGKFYTQNIDTLPIEERIFFSEGLVSNIESYRFATEKEIVEWEEYKKKLDPNYLPGDKDRFEIALKEKEEEIRRYDSSPAINEFTINNTSVWLDKATRTGLMLRFQSENAAGLEYTTLWYNGSQFPLKINLALQMLYALEIYASQCYDNTERHIAAIKTITELTDLENYDYTVGYPEKLKF